MQWELEAMNASFNKNLKYYFNTIKLKTRKSFNSKEDCEPSNNNYKIFFYNFLFLSVALNPPGKRFFCI